MVEDIEILFLKILILYFHFSHNLIRTEGERRFFAENMSGGGGGGIR